MYEIACKPGVLEGLARRISRLERDGPRVSAGQCLWEYTDRRSGASLEYAESAEQDCARIRHDSAPRAGPRQPTMSESGRPDSRGRVGTDQGAVGSAQACPGGPGVHPSGEIMSTSPESPARTGGLSGVCWHALGTHCPGPQVFAFWADTFGPPLWRWLDPPIPVLVCLAVAVPTPARRTFGRDRIALRIGHRSAHEIPGSGAREYRFTVVGRARPHHDPLTLVDHILDHHRRQPRKHHGSRNFYLTHRNIVPSRSSNHRRKCTRAKFRTLPIPADLSVAINRPCRTHCAPAEFTSPGSPVISSNRRGHPKHWFPPPPTTCSIRSDSIHSPAGRRTIPSVPSNEPQEHCP